MHGILQSSDAPCRSRNAVARGTKLPDNACELSGRLPGPHCASVCEFSQARVPSKGRCLRLQLAHFFFHGFGQSSQQPLRDARHLQAGVEAVAVFVVLLLGDLAELFRVGRPLRPQLAIPLHLFLLAIRVRALPCDGHALRVQQLGDAPQVRCMPANSSPDALPPVLVLGTQKARLDDRTGHLLGPLVRREHRRPKVVCACGGDAITRLHQHAQAAQARGDLGPGGLLQGP
mmetsp:Transcript_90957/g.260256  ORF Transcript_90957/g.260256 Transcript_90957/m.260256 type:complete len:231 (+) Transcript_90957:318-1010(+)